MTRSVIVTGAARGIGLATTRLFMAAGWQVAMAVHTQDIIDAFHDAIPLNRYGSEEEIAEAIVFLASSRASYITGQCLAADGGFESTGVGLPALRG